MFMLNAQYADVATVGQSYWICNNDNTETCKARKVSSNTESEAQFKR